MQITKYRFDVVSDGSVVAHCCCNEFPYRLFDLGSPYRKSIELYNVFGVLLSTHLSDDQARPTRTTRNCNRHALQGGEIFLKGLGECIVRGCKAWSDRSFALSSRSVPSLPFFQGDEVVHRIFLHDGRLGQFCYRF
eukprot:scaffold5314_cov167-Amphora_coffeaeformis.AAC.6